ncbi:MAG: M17 family metallopeptidase [Steroidobacteraceae bacterium]|nr:M17 family metallopeptidase [Steroidobacteraceae bacterium]
MQILPPETSIAVRRRAAPTSEKGLARTDAAAFMVDDRDPAAALAKLPHAALWLALHRKTRRTPGTPLLVTRLPNARHTLVAVGFVAAGASAFERLTLAGKMMRELVKPGIASLQCHAAGFDADDAAAALEVLASAALAAAAPMPQRKSRPVPPSALRTIDVHGGRGTDLELATATAAGNHLARWLTTLPPNVLDCVAYRRALAQLARREGWSFRFYDERALARLGAGAFLAVTRANDHRGAGIVRLTYRPAGARRARRIGLVGKGICFDTGGINLKSHKGMFQMHGDMQGSAVAVGTLLALSRRRVPLEIDCWLALTENQIGPRAYRPQEVVAALNGVTIQVVHSDAEGRMVLADTLALAARAKPALLLDFATLTGACVNALTDRYSGAFTNHAALQSELQAAGRASGERVWCFPMDRDFDDELDSAVADVMQCTMDNKGDHILAARFLSHFVPADVTWAHVDLSSSERKGGLAHVPTEFTGFGVRFATQLLGDGALLGRLESQR